MADDMANKIHASFKISQTGFVNSHSRENCMDFFSLLQFHPNWKLKSSVKIKIAVHRNQSSLNCTPPQFQYLVSSIFTVKPQIANSRFFFHSNIAKQILKDLATKHRNILVLIVRNMEDPIEKNIMEESLLQTMEEGPQGKLFSIILMNSSILYYTCRRHVLSFSI